MQLYRPVGMLELLRIYETKMRRFPPRLPEQPIFYPVTNHSYASTIAREWNTKSHDCAGYVTRFTIDDRFIAKYEKRIVGNRSHEEYWIPAEALEQFNNHIIGDIGVIESHFGPSFQGFIPKVGLFAQKDARTQLQTLMVTLDYSRMDVYCEVMVNHAAVYLHYPFWHTVTPNEYELSDAQRREVLSAIEEIWQQRMDGIPLIGSGKPAA